MRLFSIKNLLLLASPAMPCVLSAQEIKISIPSGANREYSFVLNKGINQDTIRQGTMSSAGNAAINMPEEYKDYAGIGSLRIDGMPSFNMIVNHESFSAEQRTDGKYYFKDSPENNYLYAIIQDKTAPAANPSLYASRFMELVNYNRALDKVLSQRVPNLMEKTNIRSHALKDLDFESLYTSMLWFNVVDGLIRLHGNRQSMGEDMVQILKRIHSPEVFVHLTENLITITEQYGWDDAFDIIVPYAESSGKIEIPQGKIYAAFASAKVRKGVKAPPVSGLSGSIAEVKSGYSLIVFYQPDCENCHAQMELLIKEYHEISSQNMRIISISGGNDKSVFEQEKGLYPWADKLCDFEGYAGKNFINYGIMGTPTFFLLDKDGIVLKRFAQVAELEDYMHSLEEK
jgi:peroxiredoxin